MTPSGGAGMVTFVSDALPVGNSFKRSRYVPGRGRAVSAIEFVNDPVPTEKRLARMSRPVLTLRRLASI